MPDDPYIDPALAVSDPEILARLCKIDQGDGKPPRAWNPWPHQVELWRALRAHRKVIVLKARQIGITWAMALYVLWVAFIFPAVTILIVSVGEREAQKVLRRINRLYRSLPKSVRDAFPIVKSTEEELIIGHPEGPTTIQSLPSSSAAGRGETVFLLVGDEAAHWPDPESQIASLRPTVGDIGQQVVASTAKGMNYFYDMWVEAEANGWAALFHNALARPDRDIEWVERERKELRDKGPQELPLTPTEAFIASGGGAFSNKTLQDYMENCVIPSRWRGRFEKDAISIVTRADPQGKWQVWEWPDPTREYFIAADVCGGEGGTDYSYAAVMDSISMTQVAAFHGKVTPRDFTQQLVRAGYLYRGTSGPALLVPEANNHGSAVIALLIEWHYPRVYHQEVYDQAQGRKRRRMGITTSWQSRPMMIGALQGALDEGVIGVRDKEAVREMERFVEVELPGGGSRYEASKGNDDRVMALAIAALVGTQSRQITNGARTAALKARSEDEHTPYWGAAA